MPFIPFELERWQSTWEKRVRFNLSESGVHPLTLDELLELAATDARELASIPMGYNQSDGSEALRNRIATLYPGATADHVTVTVGSSEANFIICWSLIEPGDRVAVLTPTYMQTHGLARNFGAEVAEFRLEPERGWEPDPEEVAHAIRPGTKLVVVTNPNNPTAHVLSAHALQLIVERARESGAWLLADEVYQGAELGGRTTPTVWGSYERVIVVNGLSKAYGLPGLRIGWTVTPPDLKAVLATRHDYTVIGPSPATDYLAERALGVREAILARTRNILNANYPLLDAWLTSFGDLFEWWKPDCGAICLTRYRHHLPALDLVERIRADRSILLVPGDHFQLPGHLRLGYGNEPLELQEALGELRDGLRDVLGD